MLNELKKVHADLTEAIASLAVIVSGAEPDDEALSAARLRLTRAKGRGSSLIECSIFPRLHDVAPVNSRAILDLRLETATQAVQSSEHIARWTLRAIHADWVGFQRASGDLRRMMLRRIEREAAILYPLLNSGPDQMGSA